jgi:predicted NodU family carbamoyl transferase
VALNCVTNGKILRDGKFSGLWIQPATDHLHKGHPRAAAGEGHGVFGELVGRMVRMRVSGR